MNSKDEMVLAIDSARVRHVLSHGGRTGPLYKSVPIADLGEMEVLPGGNSSLAILPRSKADSKEKPLFEYMQPTGYVLVHRDGMLLTAQRTKYAPEGRLHGKRLVGFGGHVSRTDFSGDLYEAVVSSTMRELREELELIGQREEEPSEESLVSFRALLTDDSNDVGRVHLGVIGVQPALTDSLPADGELVGFAWSGRAELLCLRADMESWSQILIDDLLAETGVLPRIVR